MLNWLSKKSRLSKTVITSLAFAMFFLCLIVWVQLLKEPDIAPCAPDRYPGRCYRVDRKVCESLWDKSNDECKKKIQELNLSTTRLIGPILFKCQVSVLDRLISYTRQNNTDCNQLHRDLESWKRSNPDF
jgi:hypothetical protein